MLGISAWYLWKGRHVRFARESLKASLVLGLVAAVLQFPLGHLHAVQVARTQPTKLAAFEGLFETQSHAPLALFGIPNAEEARLDAAIRLPSGLSILVDGRPSTEIQGLNDFPREDWPPLRLTFFPFHLMFALGALFVVVTGLGVLLWWRGRLFENKLFMKLAFVSLPLPIVANELGWLTAEVGRQPWIVYQVPGMRTGEAISTSVPGGQVFASVLLFSLLYALLLILWIYILRREVVRGPGEDPASGVSAGDEAILPRGRGSEQGVRP